MLFLMDRNAPLIRRVLFLCDTLLFFVLSLFRRRPLASASAGSSVRVELSSRSPKHRSASESRSRLRLWSDC